MPQCRRSDCELQPRDQINTMREHGRQDLGPFPLHVPHPSRRQLTKNDSPSSSTTSAPPIPTAIARAILCPSPPLNVLHSLAHMVRSMPHSSAIRYGSSPPLPSLSVVDLRDWNDLIRSRKSIGVPGSREGRWGIYWTFVL